MKRCILFFIVNIAVVLLFSLVMLFMNIRYSNLINLMVMSGIVGFSGSFISLLMSKYIALLSVNGKILGKGESEIENWLLHIVRDQSQKLGVVTPQVVIYDAFDMNAFATGAQRDSALIAVSTGLLKNMNNDEIEAVIAHEMSHVFNGDMVTITLIQGVINTFVIFISRGLAQCISYCVSFSSSANSSEESDNSNGHLLDTSSIYFFVSIILELIFGVLANILVLWFSRRREFYADAGSAKLVGCDKMIAALEKLKLNVNPEESRVVAPFCIHGSVCNVRNFLSELFMSHPPLEDRIQALRYGHYLKSLDFGD